MAVEEEGLRIFQSVKIKIGKKKNPYPQSERLNGWLHINGPKQAGSEGWRLESLGKGLLCVIGIHNTSFPFCAQIVNRKQM